MPEPVIVAPPKGEAGLIVLLLEEALPRYLRIPFVPALLGIAGPVVSMQAGESTATVRIGREEVVLEDGAARDAWFSVEGDVDALLDVATGDHVLRPVLERRIRVVPNLSGLVGALTGMAGRLVPGGGRS